MVAKRGEMDSKTLSEGSNPKAKDERPIGAEGWTAVVAEWANRLETAPDEHRLTQKAAGLDDAGYDSVAALSELNARMLYKEFEFPIPVGKALVSIIKDILAQRDGDGAGSDAAKVGSIFSPERNEKPGVDENDEEVVFITKETKNKVFDGSQGGEEKPEERQQGGSLGGSAGETTETDHEVTSGAMSEVEDNPPLPKNEQKLSPRSQERSETTSDVQSMVRSAAETFGSVGSALISSLQSQHKEVLKELRGEKKGKKIPLPELKMQDSGEKPTVLQTAAFLQEVAVLRSSHYKGVGSMMKMVVRRPNGMKTYHSQELQAHLDETDEELLALELWVAAREVFEDIDMDFEDKGSDLVEVLFEHALDKGQQWYVQKLHWMLSIGEPGGHSAIGGPAQVKEEFAAWKAAHNDMPGQRGIWVGRSQKISGGHRVVPIEWSQKRQEWKLMPTIDRSVGNR